MEIKEFKPESILLLWLGKIGDYVVSTPLIRAVRKKHPEAYIAVMVRPPVDRLAILTNDVDNVITFPKGAKSFKKLPELASKYFFKKWDMCIDLNPSYSGSSGRITKFSGAKYKVGFANPKAVRYYTHTVAQAANDEHMLHRYDRLAEYLGLAMNYRLHLDIRPEDYKAADDILKKMHIFKKFISFHPGNLKKDYSCWPKENFIRLSKEIAEKYPNYQQVYIAGPGEEEAVQNMVSEIGRAVMAPPMSLPVTAALLGRARLAVDNSTGTLHMAEAAGTPTLSFHKTYSYLCWRPLETDGAALDSGDWNTVHTLQYDKVWEVFTSIVK